VAWSIPGKLKKGRTLQERLLAECYPSTVDRTPIVMDNIRLRYIGANPWLRRKAELGDIARRLRLLPRYYDYYGREVKRLAAKDLYPWMQEVMKDSPLREAGIFRQDFYDALFADEIFHPDAELSVYSALVTVHGFIEKYISPD
jgi:hypothetical protein